MDAIYISTDDDLISMNGENKENGIPPRSVSSNVKGGFMAPTKTWLIYMGNQIDLKSRSPSPGLNLKERSPSPKRRFRESSSESDSRDKSRKSSVGPNQRKAERDPNLPIVKRSNSVKKNSSINGDLKGVDVTKKAVTNGLDRDARISKTSTANNKTVSAEKNKLPNGLARKDSSAKSDSKSDNKTAINVTAGATAGDVKNNQKKSTPPPPVAPKPSNHVGQVLTSSAKQEQEDASSKAAMTNMTGSISSNLMQETVSSRLKKISAEEYSMLERKTSNFNEQQQLASRATTQG